MASKTLILSLIFAVILLTGCASLFVAFNKKANKIKIVTAEEVVECDSIGNVTANTLGDSKSRVGRLTEKMAAELEASAIWESSKINATDIVAVSEINRTGKQTFAAYICP